jgi:hypothetical protein
MDNFKKISFLLTVKEKYNLAIISLFNSLGVLLEMLSFVIIIPVFNVIFLKENTYNYLIQNINYEDIYNFTEVFFKTRFKVNQINVSNFKTKLSPIRPYGKWFETLFDKKKYSRFYDCNYVTYIVLE